jgi:SAM-dependent methyltransferase
MRLKIKAQSLLEWVALKFNLVPTPLIDTQVAFIQARAIMAASELNIFEALGKEDKTYKQIAEICKTNPEATKHLLNCLTGIGYLTWSNEKYTLKTKFHKWLLDEHPSNMKSKLRFQLSEWNWMANLEEFVRTGKPMDLHSIMNEKEWNDYTQGMQDLSINTSAELARKLKLPSSASTLLDIGGSHGLYSIELCKKNPSLFSTILELPGAMRWASVNEENHGLKERIKYHSGNALTDDLGEELYDVIMINNVVHHFTEEENIKLAHKVAQALKPDGIYGIGEVVRIGKPGDGGTVASAAGLYFSLTSKSGAWSELEIRSWQQKAGLKAQKSISLISLPGWKMILAKK